MDLLNRHAKLMKKIVEPFSVTVTLTDPEGTVYENLKPIWNDVEHVLKMDNLDTSNPMGARSSIYFDKDTLSTPGIVPGNSWIMTGSPNAYTASADYVLEIPKEDNQLPGDLFFISRVKEKDERWGAQ
jgi:hypothetical protein